MLKSRVWPFSNAALEAAPTSERSAFGTDDLGATGRAVFARPDVSGSSGRMRRFMEFAGGSVIQGDNETFDVVISDEEQYSLWPSGTALPEGWRFAGERGARETCLRYIEKVWTDLRPLSIRDRV